MPTNGIISYCLPNGIFAFEVMVFCFFLKSISSLPVADTELQLVTGKTEESARIVWLLLHFTRKWCIMGLSPNEEKYIDKEL